MGVYDSVAGHYKEVRDGQMERDLPSGRSLFVKSLLQSWFRPSLQHFWSGCAADSYQGR
jgi:hypothetical protein